MRSIFRCEIYIYLLLLKMRYKGNVNFSVHHGTPPYMVWYIAVQSSCWSFGPAKDILQLDSAHNLLWYTVLQLTGCSFRPAKYILWLDFSHHFYCLLTYIYQAGPLGQPKISCDQTPHIICYSILLYIYQAGPLCQQQIFYDQTLHSISYGILMYNHQAGPLG